MGVVYRAQHVETGQPAALKTVLLANRNLLSSIRREIHALAGIRHPAIVRILDEGLHEGLPWYAMELLDGADMRRYCGPPGPASLTKALTCIRRLCGPLAYLHGEGIVHRDLKPDNVFVRADGALVLVDFGLVSYVGAAPGREVIDLSGVPSGTAAYMSPEQIRSELLDARSDLYAVGCILYELLTGRPPFVSEVPFQVFFQQCTAEPRPPSLLAPHIPPALEALVLRLLAKRPADRIGYAEDVASVLGKLGAEEDAPGAPRPRTYLYRPGFAGRQTVLGELEGLLAQLEAGKGGLVLLGGESGVGKTRLTTELARRVAGREIQLLTGEATPDGGALHPLRRALQAIGDRCREQGAGEAEQVLGRRGKVLARYEPSLAALPGQQAHAEPAELGPEAARLRLFGDLTETLAVAAVRGGVLLLILDDLQWADDLTLGWLEHLLRGEHLDRVRLLVVGTYRSEEAGEALGRLLRDEPWIQRAAHFVLGRLDETAIGSMIQDMLALERPPPEFTSFLAARAEGNPFFVAEFLRAAVGEGLLHRDQDGRWHVAEGHAGAAAGYEALKLPTSLRQLSLRRLQTLSPDARRLVDAAAVIGRRAHSLLVWRVARLGVPALFDATAEALRRQVLEEVEAEHLRFVHDRDPRGRLRVHRPGPPARAASGGGARPGEPVRREPPGAAGRIGPPLAAGRRVHPRSQRLPRWRPAGAPGLRACRGRAAVPRYPGVGRAARPGERPAPPGAWLRRAAGAGPLPPGSGGPGRGARRGASPGRADSGGCDPQRPGVVLLVAWPTRRGGRALRAGLAESRRRSARPTWKAAA